MIFSLEPDIKVTKNHQNFLPTQSVLVAHTVFKGMAMSTVNFLLSELRNARREPRGRRWTIEEKVVDLVLMKTSRKVLQVFETPELRRRSVKKWHINEHSYVYFSPYLITFNNNTNKLSVTLLMRLNFILYLVISSR
jgi:hypothetical protein